MTSISIDFPISIDILIDINRWIKSIDNDYIEFLSINYVWSCTLSTRGYFFCCLRHDRGFAAQFSPQTTGKKPSGTQVTGLVESKKKKKKKTKTNYRNLISMCNEQITFHYKNAKSRHRF